MKADRHRLSPLTKIRLHEEIVEQLKDRIVRGDLLPGSKLQPERELAEQLNVNRTTVREALHKLESMGLVEIKHGSGVFVKDFLESGSLELARHLLFLDGRVNPRVLMNLHELRRLLLPEISYCAAAHRSEKDLRELRQVVFESDDMPLEDKDWRVHNIIARASGNFLFVVLLNSFTEMTRDSSQRYFEVEANRRRSMKFHRAIYAAIERGDAPKAKKIMADVTGFAEVQTLTALGNDPGRTKK
jgi:GntR family transcriptional regulator, transcriptional repressor for pyruvate dehydrogenase complex